MTAHMTPEELAENFSFLDNWEDRYAYLIELGKKLPAFSEDDRIESNIVRGCTSQVWMVADDRLDDRVHFKADSDAHIVRGLIAILVKLYNGQPKDFAALFDIEGYFKKLGLEEHLSPSRRNGFYAMVARIKSLSAPLPAK